jgi:NAD+ diphosphatase
MEMNFCRRCGTPLTQTSQASYRCSNGHNIFLNSAPGVGIFLFDNDDNILLSVRAIDPDKGSLDAFGGFVDGNETFEEALEREVEEELGLHSSDYTKPVYLTSMSSTYNYGGEDCPVLSVFLLRILTSRC